ncbi:hypothetical protein CYMTET_29241 [Cymbomonas tetramitiformis]|uniref:Uncharacterized protein n=1 Tax=Cymbomonas tetramitiformis TaxID=36881 RepID=A0AAE0FL77_9CHLO|nr:hypothetical protein CYMTET_29241 [Cymbomonas tetramitiformis]
MGRRTRQRSSSRRKHDKTRLFAKPLLRILLSDSDARTLYKALLLHLSLIIFHYSLMGQQTHFLSAREITSSITRTTVPPKYGVSFVDWLKTQILEIWKDPVCGDGVCNEPYEFASFGRFGCTADCGRARDIVPVLVFIQVDFRDLRDRLPWGVADDLRERLSWNVCMRDLDREEHGMPELCWFKEEKRFRHLYERRVQSLYLKQGGSSL